MNSLAFRYRGYRDKPMSLSENPYGNRTNNYDFTKDYWHILSAQLFFVIAFLVSEDLDFVTDYCHICVRDFRAQIETVKKLHLVQKFQDFWKKKIFKACVNLQNTADFPSKFKIFLFFLLKS